jgi:hypothetical protein
LKTTAIASSFVAESSPSAPKSRTKSPEEPIKVVSEWEAHLAGNILERRSMPMPTVENATNSLTEAEIVQNLDAGFENGDFSQQWF